jgi:formylmethanofuran dehydrogenase subunit D
MNLLLNTSRKIDNDQLKEFCFGDNNSLEEKLAVSFLNPANCKKLKVKSGSNIRISLSKNSIVVKCYEDPNVPEGMILLPLSIWSNQLTEIEGEEIKYKNITVNVEQTADPVLSFSKLIEKIKARY